jgi:hypothetical protein
MKVSGVDIKVTGGPIRIGRLDGERYSFLDDPERVIQGLKQAEARVDLFTFTQRLPDVKAKYAYHLEWDNFAALPVSTFETWWTDVLDNKTRNMIRRAEKKGVELREVPFDDALVRGIWTVYNECPFRQGKPYGHYGKTIETVHREEATFLDRSIFIGAFHEQALIGFIKLTWDETRTQAGLMNIVSMMQHRDKAPTNALIAHAVRACADRHIPYLVYASFAYGNKRPDSLSDFKRNNGFQKFDIPRYYVPLTLIGSVALRLGLHRKWAERIPEPVLARIRDLRSAWYQRKFQSFSKAPQS